MPSDFTERLAIVQTCSWSQVHVHWFGRGLVDVLLCSGYGMVVSKVHSPSISLTIEFTKC